MPMMMWTALPQHRPQRFDYSSRRAFEVEAFGFILVFDIADKKVA